MAAARNLLFKSLQTLERSQVQLHQHLHSQQQLQQSFRVTVIRAQSTWVAPTKRSRNFSATGPLRPVVNGKAVAFHVNDLKNIQKPFATTSTNGSSTGTANGEEQTRIRDYKSDLVVVLDMDECLIHSQFMDGPGARYTHQVRRNKGSSPGEATVDTFNITLPDGETVRVHERPFLHDFLARVSEKYETHVFTAAMEVYAKPVLKKLDPDGTIFTRCWYRESCKLDSDVGAYVKDLGIAWTGDKLKRTVLVDNNPLSFLANPENGILVSNFYNDPKDSTLPAVLALLEELDGEEDVRPVLDARFSLRSALGELSKGRPFTGRDQEISEQSTGTTQQQEEAVEATTTATPRPNLVAAAAPHAGFAAAVASS